MTKKATAFAALPLLLIAGAAWGAHPEVYRARPSLAERVERVQVLAHEVEDRARQVHRSAERLAHHRDYREERALVRLHELEDLARHFHSQVERYGQSFRHSEGDFRALRRAYSRAAYAVHDLHAYDRVDRQFDRLSDAMYELEMYAADLFYGTRVSHRHRRYRHDRDWDSDSDSDSDYRRGRARIVLPRVRVGWDWLDH